MADRFWVGLLAGLAGTAMGGVLLGFWWGWANGSSFDYFYEEVVLGSLLYRDSIDDALGFLHSRDLARLALKEQLNKASLLRAVREIYFIPENTPLHTQLQKFQSSKERIGLVVDEFGDIQGLVTLEDILEEVVGTFTTDVAQQQNEEIKAEKDGYYLVEGGINLRDLNRDLQLNFPTDGPKTLNGLVLEYLEDIPETNISLILYGCVLEIIEIQDNMIKTVRLRPKPAETAPA